MINVKYKLLTDTARTPTRGSQGAAGLDLYADLQEPVSVWPGCSVQITTGVAMEIPDGYYGAVYARSGLARKKGLRPPNCVGVIDSDYRGNIGVDMYNDGNKVQTIHPGERIAQLVIQQYAGVILNKVEELSPTERGTGGFGSTGR